MDDDQKTRIFEVPHEARGDLFDHEDQALLDALIDEEVEKLDCSRLEAFWHVISRAVYGDGLDMLGEEKVDRIYADADRRERAKVEANEHAQPTGTILPEPNA